MYFINESVITFTYFQHDSLLSTSLHFGKFLIISYFTKYYLHVLSINNLPLGKPVLSTQPVLIDFEIILIQSCYYLQTRRLHVILSLTISYFSIDRRQA